MRSQFPVFQKRPDLVYLDTAATCQIPQSVHDFVQEVMQGSYANMHRWVYDLAYDTEQIVDRARSDVSSFINAPKDEIIFTSWATAGINLSARTLQKNGILRKGDEVILGVGEHHANIVPWQQLQEEIGINIKWLPVNESYEYDLDQLGALMTHKTKLVSLQHVSNVTWVIHPIERIRDLIWPDILLLIDGCQAVGHTPVNVANYGADFYVFSWHKMYAYPGVGIMHAKKDHLRNMTPAIGGGGSINQVSQSGYEPAWLPHKWEPGTQNIAGICSLAPAIDFMKSNKHHHDTREVVKKLRVIPWLTLYGHTNSPECIPIFSFTIQGHHINDLAELCAEQNICIRAGHMCCQTYMNMLGVPWVLRMSLWAYSTMDEVARLCEILRSL